MNQYIKPELSVEEFTVADIITASDLSVEDGPGTGGDLDFGDLM